MGCTNYQHIYINIYIYIILNHRSGRTLRVFNPLTCHLNRFFRFYYRGTWIRPTMDFGSTCWALGWSDPSGLVESFTHWMALLSTLDFSSEAMLQGGKVLGTHLTQWNRFSRLWWLTFISHHPICYQSICMLNLMCVHVINPNSIY